MPLISVISHAVNSRSSSSSKYDPEILKAEIVTAKSRVRKFFHNTFLNDAGELNNVLFYIYVYMIVYNEEYIFK